MQFAQRIHSLGCEQNDSALKVGAYRALAPTAYFLGDFETAREYAMRGVAIWRSGAARQSIHEREDAYPVVQDYADLLRRGVLLFLTDQE